MEAKTVHTALPWKAIERGNIVDANGSGVACAYRGPAGQQSEAAALIVRACNAHDDLVKSLREVHQACDWLMAQVIALDPTFRPTQSPIWDAILQGSAALAATEQS